MCAPANIIICHMRRVSTASKHARHDAALRCRWAFFYLAITVAVTESSAYRQLRYVYV